MIKLVFPECATAALSAGRHRRGGGRCRGVLVFRGVSGGGGWSGRR